LFELLLLEGKKKKKKKKMEMKIVGERENSELKM
jgi:hypothetical protein